MAFLDGILRKGAGEQEREKERKIERESERGRKRERLSIVRCTDAVALRLEELPRVKYSFDLDKILFREESLSVLAAL